MKIIYCTGNIIGIKEVRNLKHYLINAEIIQRENNGKIEVYKVKENVIDKFEYRRLYKLYGDKKLVKNIINNKIIEIFKSEKDKFEKIFG